MNKRSICLVAGYPLYAFVVVAILMQLDIPEKINRLLPHPYLPSYGLTERFRQAEVFEGHVTLRKKEAFEVSDIVKLGHVPSIREEDLRSYFHDPAFKEETVEWSPGDRYEKEYIFSVKRPLANLYVFGDSYIVSYDFKSFAYLLNEEHHIPTYRRTYSANGGPMETVYGFLLETPKEELQGKTVVVEISEGGGGNVPSQVNGTPFFQTVKWLSGKTLYSIASFLPAGIHIRENSRRNAGAADPVVRPISVCRTVTGREIRKDSKHFNPLLFEYQGRCRSMGLFDRDVAYLSWDGIYFESLRGRVSLDNWFRRLGKVAREKNVRLAVLYVPTKLSVYWPIIEPALDYESMFRYASHHWIFNRSIRSAKEFRDVLPISIGSWRRMVTEVCRREGIGLVDLTDPYRAAAIRGESVYRDFDTHWNDFGIRIAAEEVATYAKRTIVE
jgi:hypothetical protein